MKEKREIDNRELSVKIESSRLKIKNKMNRLIKEINEQCCKISKIKEKYKLNEYNNNLFNEKSKKIIDFKEEIIALWKDKLTES